MVNKHEMEFCFYKLGMSGSFMTSLIETMFKADVDNLDLLGKAYPGLVKVILKYRGESGYWQDLVNRWNEDNPYHKLVA